MKIFYTLIVSLLLVSSTSVFASNYYWVGGSGDWSDINHWATSSGGTLKHIQTPTSLDNVIFDANSLTSNETVNLNSQSIFCKNFDIEDITHNLTFVGICTEWHIYGSVKLNTLFTQNSAIMYFEALSGINYIKSNAHAITADIHFTGQSTWKLQDSLHCYNISLESGTFNTESKKLTLESFISTTNNSRQLTLGTSIISIKEWNVSGTTFSVNAGSSRITINTPFKSFKHSNTGNLTYNDIVFAEIDSLTSLSSNISFHKVQFMSDGVICQIQPSSVGDAGFLTAGVVHTIGSKDDVVELIITDDPIGQEVIKVFASLTPIEERFLPTKYIEGVDYACMEGGYKSFKSGMTRGLKMKRSIHPVNEIEILVK